MLRTRHIDIRKELAAILDVLKNEERTSYDSNSFPQDISFGSYQPILRYHYVPHLTELFQKTMGRIH